LLKSDEKSELRIRLAGRGRCGSWISNLPIFGTGLEWTNEEWTTMTKLWLGIDQDQHGHCPYCTQNMSPRKKHALSCRSGGDLIRRHNALRNFIYGLCQEAGLSPILEKTSTGDVPGLRPADVYIKDYEPNVNLSIDVAITCPFYGTFKLDMNAAERYANEIKEKKYGSMFKGTTNKFTPVVFDTFGGINEDGETVLKDLIKRSSETSAKYTIGTQWRRLLNSLHKNNVKMILRRMIRSRIPI